MARKSFSLDIDLRPLLIDRYTRSYSPTMLLSLIKFVHPVFSERGTTPDQCRANVSDVVPALVRCCAVIPLLAACVSLVY